MPRPRFNYKTRILLPVGLLAAFVAVLVYAGRDAILPATQVQVVPVMLASAASANEPAIATVQAPGWVEPDPFPIAVPALADGVVKEVLVLEGQPVKSGQVVARLVDDDAKLALARAEALVAHHEATLHAAQETWDNPVDRTQAVALAAGKAAELEASLKMLESEVAAQVARTEELRYENQRVQQAFEQNAATPLEATVTRQRLVAAEATLEATKRKQAVLEAQQKQAAADLTAATDHQRLRTSETLALSEARNALAEAKAARDEAKLRLERMEIRSPADGVVMARRAWPGSKMMLAMDEPLSAVAVTLYDPKQLQVRVDVPLADAAKVSVGQEAEVVVAVLPDRVFKGKVTRAVHEADIQKNTQQFKVAIIDPSPELKPEMLTRVKFLAPPARADGGDASVTAVYAPQSLIQTSGDAAQGTVLVVDTKQNVAQSRTVRLGSGRRDGWAQVTDGLFPGDVLIAHPPGVADGDRVRIAGEANVAPGGQVGPAGPAKAKGGHDGVH